MRSDVHFHCALLRIIQSFGSYIILGGKGSRRWRRYEVSEILTNGVVEEEHTDNTEIG